MQTEHWIHIYEKPAVAIGGTYPTVTYSERYYGRYLAYDYKHKISAFGGDDTAEARLMIPKAEAEVIFGEYIGNRVAIYARNSFLPIWEGLINRVNIETNGVKLSRSLDGMMNRVSVKYQNPSASPETGIVSEVTNADSIALYGSKEGTLDAGLTYSNVTGIATALRNKALNQKSWPQISTAASSSREFKVTIEMIGFFHTLEWDTRLVTNTTSSAAYSILFNLANYGNSAGPRNNSVNGAHGWGIFWNDRDDTDMNLTNNAFNMTLEKRAGESALSKVRKIVEAGDGTNDWIFQISRTVHRGGSYTLSSAPSSIPVPYRRGIYRQANTTVAYHAQAFGDGRIYTPYGALVHGYDVLPDRAILITDILQGWDKEGTDPRSAYIESVSYDGNTGVAQWVSKDSLRLEDTMRLRQAAKPTNARFGANPNYYAS